MLAELRCTPINGVFALLAQPFADHRGAFLKAFKDCFPARSDANNTRYRKRCIGRSEGGEVVHILRNGARPVWSAIRRTGPWRQRSAPHQRVVPLEQGCYSLQPAASLVIHELSFGIQRLADGCRKERFRSYLQNLWRLMGCSCLYATTKSASFKFAMGRGWVLRWISLISNQPARTFARYGGWHLSTW
jgi:hypothetical protein